MGAATSGLGHSDIFWPNFRLSQANPFPRQQSSQYLDPWLAKPPEQWKSFPVCVNYEPHNILSTAKATISKGQMSSEDLDSSVPSQRTLLIVPSITFEWIFWLNKNREEPVSVDPEEFHAPFCFHVSHCKPVSNNAGNSVITLPADDCRNQCIELFYLTRDFKYW